jgi:methylated-DNA-protein-cysteine methyltransferase-like protein
MTSSKPPASPLYHRIYALVRQIPAGHVATYGQLARLVGCTPRTVGFALAALPAGNKIPWQRVVNRQGRISPRSEGEGSHLQSALLAGEGLSFDPLGRIDLSAHLWAFAPPEDGT